VRQFGGLSGCRSPETPALHLLLIGMRARFLRVAVLGALLGGLALPSSAAALSEGTLSGVVTGQDGPVAGAVVAAKGEAGFVAHTTTAADGSYSVAAWPGTYEIGVEPPAGGPDGFTVKSGAVINEGATTTENIVLNQEDSSARISGNASYGDHAPDAGVEVSVFEEHFVDGPVQGHFAYTDEAGDWDAGELPAGIYSVSYSVNTVNPASGQTTNESLGGETVFLTPGTHVLSQTLSGARPQGFIEATITEAEGWPATEGTMSLTFPSGPEFATIGKDGVYRLWAPSGTYSLRAWSEWNLDDQEWSQQVSVSHGQTTRINIQLQPNPIPGGISASNEQQDVAWLNAQRERWGLPGGISALPLWSNACAAHDAYLSRNHILEHPENPTLPGASPGGRWGGEHSILSEGGDWSASENPWYDAPIHLNQMLTPALSIAGLDDSHGYQCMTTWPGMRRKGVPKGTIYTFPGDGTAGLPPVELANESPTTPNKELGIPEKAGRQLFLYEEGASIGLAPLQVLAASLQDQAGNKVPVKWLDQESSLGGFLTGAIIVPVEPLKPFTAYTATVRLAAVRGLDGTNLPEVTHTWSFTTGHNNPGGNWGESVPKPKQEKKRAPQREIRLKWERGQVIVRGWHFNKGKVVIKRKVLLKSKRRFNGRVMARAHVGAKGTFRARFHWPKRHISLRVYQDGKSTFGIYNPPHPPSWYRHHHKHGGNS
jgi:hypothetical protein